MINRPASNISSSSSLLKVMYETPVNTLATENSELLIDKDILASQKNDYKCYYCSNVCNSRAGRILHEKKHRKEITKEKRRRTLMKHRKKLKHHIYSCEECDEQFSKKILLTKHMKSHLKQYKCKACQKSFEDKMEFEWHDAIDNGLNYTDLPSSTYRTRSQSRLSCHNERRDKRSQSCFPELMSYTPISEMSNEKINGQFNFKRKSPAFSDFSSKSAPYKRIRSSQYNQYDSEESADEISEFKSIESVSMSSVRNSPTISTHSKYNSYVKLFNYNNPHQCKAPDCLQAFNSLDSLTVHEITQHNKLALFRCKECRKSFTTSDYLNQHKAEKHPVQVLCVLCDILQQGLEVEIHAHMHRESSIRCELCGKQFLNNYTLEEHLKKPQTHRLQYPTKISVLIRTNTGEPRKSLNHRFEICESDICFGALTLDISDSDSYVVNDLKVDLPWRS